MHYPKEIQVNISSIVLLSLFNSHLFSDLFTSEDFQMSNRRVPILPSSQQSRREYLTMQQQHPQLNNQRRGSLDGAGSVDQHHPAGTPPLPPPPPPSNLLPGDTRCQMGLPQAPGPRIRHPLDFCTLRRSGRTVQFADQQRNNVSAVVYC